MNWRVVANSPSAFLIDKSWVKVVVIMSKKDDTRVDDDKLEDLPWDDKQDESEWSISRAEYDSLLEEMRVLKQWINWLRVYAHRHNVDVSPPISLTPPGYPPYELPH